MKKRLLSIFLLFFAILVQGQINIATGGTVTTCSDVFVDSGGLGGNYSSNENYEITICPDTVGNYIQLDFTTINVEGGFDDFLVIFNGDSSSSPIFGTINDDNTCDITQYTSSATNGCLTIVFESDNSFNQSGWEAAVTCTTTPGGGTTLPENAICGGSGAFCADAGALEFPNSSNNDCVPDAPSIVVTNSCLGSAPNPAWYFVEIGLAGNIVIDIAQTTGPGGTGVGLDVDYVLWGPFPDVPSACVDFTTGNCSGDHNCMGTAVDCSYSTAPVETATIPNAQVGEFYMFLITNFNGAAGYITLSQTNIGNPGAGSTDCCPYLTGTNPSTCGASDGSIEISLLAPNTLYTITYNNPTPQSVTLTTNALGEIMITGLAAGTYTNIDTNTPACAPEDIVLIDAAAPSLNSLTTTSPICAGANADFVITGTPNSVVSYTINGGATATATLDATGNVTISIGGVTGNTVIALIDITINSCTVTLSNTATVVVNPIPILSSLSSNSPLCTGQDAVFMVNGSPNATVTYTINGGAAITLVLDAAGNGVVTLPAIIVDTTMTLSNISLNGCSVVLTNSEMVIIDPVLVVSSLIGNGPICVGQDAIFDVVGSPNSTITYTVNGGAPLTLNMDATGNGMITVTGAIVDVNLSLTSLNLSGCSVVLTNNATVVVTPDPSLTSLTTVSPVCEGEDAVFTFVGTPNATVTYSINGGAPVVVVLDALGNGIVTITGIPADVTLSTSAIAISGCNSVITNSETVVVIAAPEIINLSGNGPVCTDDTAVFTITGTANATVTYSLDGGGSTQTIVLDGAGNGTVSIPTVTGNQTIDLSDIQITSGDLVCNTVLSETLTIVVNPMPYAGTDGSLIICDTAANAIHLIDLINGEQSGGVWAQTSGSGGTFNPNSAIYTPSAGATTATFTYTVAGIPPCPDDVSNVLISIDNTPTLAFTSSTDPTTCMGADGTITLTTSNLPDGTYTVDYEDATPSAQTATMVVVGDVGTISGLASGTYNNITVTNVGCTSVEDVDVQLTDPPLPTLVLSANTGPTTCSGIDGSITLTTSNLPDGSYTVAYEDGTGTPQTTTMVVSGNSGVISNLPAGDYNNITVTHLNCTSIDDVDVQLTDPPLPVLAINASSDPTTCDGSDGTITLTTANLPDGSYTVSYEDAMGAPQAETIIITGDVGVITGLLEGEYNNITIVYNNCTSVDDVDVVLSDPLPSIIAIIATSNPTICDGTDGSITLSTTNLPDGTYTINYEDATATPQTTTVTVVANVGLITGLSEGTYNNITVTFISCTSIEDIDAVLVDPLPAIISIISTTDPTTCDGSDGSITLSTANLPDGTHVINYEDEFGVPQTNMMVVTGNVGVITGLSEGQFNNITVTFISCTSIDDIDVELNDPIPSIIAIISVVDPSMCNGTDGSIVLSVANLIDGVYTVNYDDANGIQQTTTIDVVNNVGTISNLSSGVYNNIVIISFSCMSVEDVDVVLSDPIPAIIAIISTTNPSTCGGSEGSIVLSVFNLPDGTYTIDYEDAVGLPQTSTMVVVADVGTIVDLAEGMYSNITVTNVGCTSLEDIDVVLVDPLPPVINDNMDMDPICETDAVLDGVMPHDLTLNIPYILGNQSGITVTFYEALADATSGNNPIVDETAYLNINPSPPVSTQTIYVRAVDDVTGCFTTTSFIITVMSTEAEIPNPLTNCDDDNDGHYYFVLHNTITLNEITNGNPNITVTYYETLAQANAGFTGAQLASPYFNVVAYNQTVYARAQLITFDCYRIVELELNVIDGPALPQGDLMYSQCEDDGSTDGFVEFDLTSYEISDLLAVIIANGGDVSNYTVNYYTDIDASGNPDLTTLINNPGSFQNTSTPDQVIYASVIDNITGCESIQPIRLHVDQLPEANYAQQHKCDDSVADGFTEFNLVDYIDVITGGALNVETTFYTNQSDAESGSGNNIISNPSSYVNTVNPQPIFVRISDQSTGCSAVALLVLHVDPLPTPLNNQDIIAQLGNDGVMEACDGNVDGSGSIAEQVAEFDLTLWEIQILTGNGPGVELGVSPAYYTSYDDAVSQMNIIPSPESYTNTSNPQTIYVRVTNDGTGVIPQTNGSSCFVIVEFQIYVPIPQITISGNDVLCVDQNGVPIATATLPVLLANVIPAGAYDYQWTLNGIAIPGAINESYTVSQGGEYAVTVSGPTNFNCINYASIIVNVSGIPDNFNANVTTNAFSDSHQIVAMATSSNPNTEFLYALDEAQGGEFSFSGIFNNVSPGIHIITITDGKGCWSEVVEVLVIDYPHFFTPNGDGVNDTWQIIGIEGIPISIIYIFDRYGKLLSQLDPDGPGWDGTYNGHMMPASDYWFTINYVEGGNPPTEKEFKAHFSLKR